MPKIVLILALLLTTPLFAQYPPAPVRRAGGPSSNGRYRTFGVAHIPSRCKNARILYGEKVCRVYVRFDRKIDGTPIFFTEDWSNKEDSTYHIRLINPSSRGIYIEAMPGHKIWWQVNTR